MDVYEKSLELHRNAQGKIRVESKVELHGAEDLSLAYSPGVAQPCLEIQKDYDKIYEYTAKDNHHHIKADTTEYAVGAGVWR